MNNVDSSGTPEQIRAGLVGRTQELDVIAGFLRCGQSVSLVGPPRSGKTLLLLHLMHSTASPGTGLDRDNLFVYLDCESLATTSPPAIFGRFSGAMAAALAERDRGTEPGLESEAANPTRLAFEAAVRKLNQRGLRVVLILDGFEWLSRNSDLDVTFYNVLRSIAGRYQLVFLTASVRPLIELTYSSHPNDIVSSPFFNIFASCCLDAWEEGPRD